MGPLWGHPVVQLNGVIHTEHPRLRELGQLRHRWFTEWSRDKELEQAGKGAGGQIDSQELSCSWERLWEVSVESTEWFEYSCDIVLDNTFR